MKKVELKKRIIKFTSLQCLVRVWRGGTLFSSTYPRGSSRMRISTWNVTLSVGKFFRIVEWSLHCTSWICGWKFPLSRPWRLSVKWKKIVYKFTKMVGNLAELILFVFKVLMWKSVPVFLYVSSWKAKSNVVEKIFLNVVYLKASISSKNKNVFIFFIRTCTKCPVDWLYPRVGSALQAGISFRSKEIDRTLCMKSKINS